MTASRDPDVIERGRARLDHALTHSLLMPGEIAAFRAIVSALDTAQQVLRDPAPDVHDPIAASAGILLATLDAYTAALAELGGERS